MLRCEPPLVETLRSVDLLAVGFEPATSAVRVTLVKLEDRGNNPFVAGAMSTIRYDFSDQWASRR